MKASASHSRSNSLPRGALLAAATIIVMGCGFDPTAEEYDRLRFDELQKADCTGMAEMGTRHIFKSKNSKETYDSIFQRCRTMQSMSFDEYRAAADQARNGGSFEEAALEIVSKRTKP